MSGFAGLPRWGVWFYAELERRNTKEFWAAHKSQWERDVREPIQALVDELEAEFGPAKLFRPYRDVRFSTDKSPYKTHQGALVGPGPGIGYYVQLSSDGLMVGGGFRSHSPAHTEAFRAAVADDATGHDLVLIAAALENGGFTLEGAALKTRPRGYPSDHPRLGLLRRKELMGVKRLGEPTWLDTPAAMDHVRDAWRAVRPLAEWVVANVDVPAEAAPRTRRSR